MSNGLGASTQAARAHIHPCNSCPYRKDAPVGLWDPSEFQNLLAAERDPMRGSIFACHGEAKKAPAERKLCVGWLLDQKARNMPSIQLRLALIKRPEVVEQYERASGEWLELYSSIGAWHALGVRLRRAYRPGTTRS